MLNKYGDKTEPCLTPKFTSKEFDQRSFHLTQASQDDSQFSNMNFLHKGFQKWSYNKQADRQTRPKLYTTSLRGWSITHNTCSQKLILWCTLQGRRRRVVRIKVRKFVERIVQKALMRYVHKHLQNNKKGLRISQQMTDLSSQCYTK